MMQQFAALCDAVAATTKKLEKLRLIKEYLLSEAPDSAAIAAGFLSGRPFPAHEETTLNVGGRLIWNVVGQLSAANDGDIANAYRATGDVGAASERLLSGKIAERSTLSLIDLEAAFRHLSLTRGNQAKALVLQQLIVRCTPVEAKYVIKLCTGDLRIGSREALVEEAIAKAWDQPLEEVRRANMLLGDIGATLQLASHHRLHDARMRIFHPLGFMLASPAESSAEAFEYMSGSKADALAADAAPSAVIEDKYDGVRAQAHCSQGRVRLFSRTLDDITESFPEVAAALAAMPEVILDGEVLAWQAAVNDSSPDSGFASHSRGRALAFGSLQKRLGRKKVSRKLIEEVPVAYVCFDVLYAGGELVVDRPLHERLAILDRIFAEFSEQSKRVLPLPQPASGEQASIFADTDRAPVLRAPTLRATSVEALDAAFDAARQRGNEGLMIKDADAPYQPGRHGKSWLKMKRELATLDVVVTAAEYGNGKRAHVLSDYTFAVRDGERFVNVGKAYSGLTDDEIAGLTEHFKQTTLIDYGHHRLVQPDTILEVAFNNIMRSDRHESGFALRFPRIVRVRADKSPADIDTVERVRQIYDAEVEAGRSAGKTA